MCCDKNAVYGFERAAGGCCACYAATRIGLACVLNGRAANSFIHDTSSGRCFVAWCLVEVAILNAVAAWYCTVRQ